MKLILRVTFALTIVAVLVASGLIWYVTNQSHTTCENNLVCQIHG